MLSVQKLGVCYFSLELFLKFLGICEKAGYVKPTVFVTLYNVVSRDSEKIIPILHEHGVAVEAHR